MLEIGQVYWMDYSDCDSDCLNTTLLSAARSPAVR